MNRASQFMFFQGGQVLLGGGAPPYLGQVATRSQIPTILSAGATQLMTRSHHIARDNISALQLAYANWYVNSTTFTETGSGGTATITASIEYPVGVFTQIKWVGSSSGSIPTLTTLLSDFASVSIPNGADFWVRTYWTNASGILFYGKRGSTEYIQNGTSGVTDRTMSGTLTPGGSSNCYAPIAILGVTRKSSVLLLGDSRTFGSNDTLDDGSDDQGELARSIGPQFGYINCGLSGDHADFFVASHALRMALAQYVSHAVVQYGINDITNSRTKAQIEADYQSILSYFPAGKKTFGTTKPPVTTTSDSWATLVNQALHATNGVRTALNDDIRAGLSGFAGYFEIADQVESSRNSGKWIVNGTANYATSDGVHGSVAIYNLIRSSGCIPASAFRR